MEVSLNDHMLHRVDSSDSVLVDANVSASCQTYTDPLTYAVTSVDSELMNPSIN